MRLPPLLTPLLMMGAATACLPTSQDDFHPEEVHLMEDALPPMTGAHPNPGDSILVMGPITGTGGTGGGPRATELRELEALEWY